MPAPRKVCGRDWLQAGFAYSAKHVGGMRAVVAGMDSGFQATHSRQPRPSGA